MKNKEGDKKDENGTEVIQEEQPKLPITAGPAVLDSLPTNSNHITTSRDESVQYAAVRKSFKKTASLPECKCGPDTAPPSVEVSNYRSRKIQSYYCIHCHFFI